MPIRLNNHIQRILDTGDTSDIAGAFIWESAPQGHDYWWRVEEAGQLTSESRQALEELVGIRQVAPAYSRTLDDTQRWIVERTISNRNTSNLMSAFTWQNTRQGSDYWHNLCESETLTEEAVGYLQEILDEARGNEPSVEPATYEKLEEKLEMNYKWVELSVDRNGELVMYDTDRGGKILSGPHPHNLPGNQLGTGFRFEIDSYWRSEYIMAGFPVIEDTQTRIVVKKNEEGVWEPFGELHILHKAFGFKTVSDYAKFMFKLFRRETVLGQEEPYLWPSRETLDNLLSKSRIDDYDYRAVAHTTFYFRPVFTEEGVSYFANVRDFERNRRTTTTIGRYLRKIVPGITDIQVERAVDFYNKQFKKRDFVLKRGMDRPDFAHAYNGKQAEMLNPHTSSARKSLANSCMRNMRIEGMSPAEVFASGDFEILWLEDENGLIGGRVVVYLNKNGDKPQAGPLYGVCEHSLDLLEAAVAEMGAADYDHADWTGARLLRIPVYGGSGILMIYCDMAEEGWDDGTYIHLEHRHSDTNVQTTEGLINGRGCEHCCECDDSIYEGEEYHDDHDNLYCSSCYNERYTRCGMTDEEVERNDTVDVYTSNSNYAWRASETNPRFVTIGPNVNCEECVHSGEEWLADDMFFDIDGNFISPRYANNNMYFVNDAWYTEEQLKKHGIDEYGEPLEQEEEEEEKEEAA